MKHVCFRLYSHVAQWVYNSYLIHSLLNLIIIIFALSLHKKKQTKKVHLTLIAMMKKLCQFQFSASNSPDVAKLNRWLATPIFFYFLFSPRGFFLSLFLAFMTNILFSPPAFFQSTSISLLSASLYPGHVHSLSLLIVCLCW